MMMVIDFVVAEYLNWSALYHINWQLLCESLCSLTDKAVKEYSVYKPHLMFFGLANCIPHMLFAVSSTVAVL